MKKKQLDNSNPSKVLECLEKVKGYRTGGLNSPEVYLEETKEYNTIKQYILRTQKQNLKSIDKADPSKAIECLNKIVESFNETTTGIYGLGEVVIANDLIYSFKNELTTIEQALTELKAIKEASPSEAMKCLKKLNNPCLNYIDFYKCIETIEQALKEKIVWKNIHNTKVRIPFYNIINGTTREERFKIAEDIYYHWEEMKEKLEDELEEALNQLKQNKQELAKYKTLEEEIDFPLDVAFRALTNGIYTKESQLDTKLELFEVRGIEKNGVSVISKFCGYAECDFTCKYKDYKKTWWLKEDKSE